jgi:vacuolar-type H+-ATPase subunit H
MGDADALPRTESDLEAAIDGLQEFVTKGPALGSYRLLLDLHEFGERIEQIIALLPKEVRRARRITREEQRIIQDAKDEARRLLEEARAEAEQLVAEAREEAERLVEASAIRQRALEQAEATIARAEETANDIREKSYTYAHQVITNVETSLKRLTQSVEQDKDQLEAMRPENG